LQLRFREISNARENNTSRPRGDSLEEELKHDDVQIILTSLRSKLGVSSNRTTPVKQSRFTSRTPSPSMMMMMSSSRSSPSKRRSKKLSKDSVDAAVDVAATAVTSTSRRRAVSDGASSTFSFLRRRPSAQFNTSRSGEGMSVSFDLIEEDEKEDDDDDDDDVEVEEIEEIFPDKTQDVDEDDLEKLSEVYLNVMDEQHAVKLIPRRIFGRRQLAKVSCGSNHCVALTRYGEAFSWGLGPNGSLGTGLLEHPKMVMPPRRITTIRGCCMLSSAGEHNMIVTTKGT